MRCKDGVLKVESDQLLSFGATTGRLVTEIYTANTLSEFFDQDAANQISKFLKPESS